MNTHTPGPWEWDGKFIVCIPHAEGVTCFRTNPEDARLIAAAPDLLKALKQIEFDWDGEEEDMYEARAAIAKAEGKDSA